MIFLFYTYHYYYSIGKKNLTYITEAVMKINYFSDNTYVSAYRKEKKRTKNYAT